MTGVILVTKLPTGLLLQKDGIDLIIDEQAIATVLPAVLRELIDSGKAIAAARKESFENGLQIGRERGMIEAETKYRLEEQRLLELDEQLALKVVRAHMAA